MTTETETPVTSTIGRMPIISFSDDADYAALSALLCEMDGYVWQVELRNGESIIGEIKTGEDDTITVTPRHPQTCEPLPYSSVVELDDVIRFVYL